MPLAEVQGFYQKIQNDPAFSQLFNKAVKTATDTYLEQVILNFAREQGFDFSLEELKQGMAAYKIADAAPSDSTANPFILALLKSKSISRPALVDSAEATLSVTKLEKIFVWLSGASPKILATCPESEQKKHAALGGAVLIPALLAIVTASFLLYTLNFSIYAIVPVSLLWSCMILLMDRALLATYRKGFSWWGKFGQFSLRFSIALLIAVTVAHPVVLLLFSERIEAAYNEGRIKTERAKLALQCDIKNPQSDLQLLDNKIAVLREELKNHNRFFEPPICTDASQQSKQMQAPQLEKLTQELEILKAKQTQANQDVALFIENAEKEKQGIPGNGLTGVRGCKKGTQCKKWLSQASERKDDSIQLGKEIVALEGQINQINQKIANQLIENNKTNKKQCEKEREELKTIRATQYDLDQKSLESLNDQRNLMSHRCAEKDSFITNLKPDVLTQTELLTQLIFPNHRVAWHNLLIFLIFMLLFLAIDMLAVVLKMARTGIYEAKVDIVENHNKLLEFIHQRHLTVTQFSEMASKEQACIEKLGIEGLKHGLDENFRSLNQSFTQLDRRKLSNFFEE